MKRQLAILSLLIALCVISAVMPSSGVDLAYPPVSGWTNDVGIEKFPSTNPIGVRLVGEGSGLFEKTTGIWHFNNSLADSIDSLDFTGTGSPIFNATTVKLGSHSIELDGATQYLSKTDIGTAFGGTSTFTFVIWIYPEKGSPDNYFFKLGDVTDPSRALDIGNTANKVCYRNAVTGAQTAANTTITLNTWHLIILEYNSTGNTVKVWQDNVLVIDTTDTGAIATNPNLVIGWDTPTYTFDGFLDEGVMFPVVLTSDERSQIWNSGVGLEILGYSTTSPIFTTGWLSIPDYTIFNGIGAFINSISGTGEIKMQYAINNGSFNGIWNTPAWVSSDINSKALTHIINSVNLKGQLNTNGLQQVEFIPDRIMVNTPYPYPASSNVSNLVAYGNGLVGNVVKPAPSDVRTGIGYGAGGVQNTGTMTGGRRVIFGKGEEMYEIAGWKEKLFGKHGAGLIRGIVCSQCHT